MIVSSGPPIELLDFSKVMAELHFRGFLSVNSGTNKFTEMWL